MVIQRIQTLYLILGIALMTVFFFLPFGYEKLIDLATGQFTLDPMKAIDRVGFIIPTAASILLMILAVFSFKKLPTQKLFVILSALITLAEAIMVVYWITAGAVDTNPEYTVINTWGGGGILLLGALLVQFMAIRGISHDQKILRSYDRLR